MRNFRFFVFVTILDAALLGFLQPAIAQEAAPQEKNVDDRIEALDQKVRILERQSELDKENQAAKAKEASILSAGKDGIFTLRSADNNFILRVGGYIQADGRFFFDDNAPSLTNTFLLRRVRPILEGTVFKYYDFRIMPDFGGGTTVLQDAYISFTYWPQAKLQTGKFKEPVGLERLQSGTNLLFVERALPTNLVPNRDVGVQLSGDLWGNRLSYALGYFNGVVDGGSGDTDTSTNDGKDAAARIFAQPFKLSDIEPLQGLGLGISGSYGRERGSATVSNLPTYHTPAQQSFFTYITAAAAPGPSFANGHRIRYSPQAYYYWGPFGLLGEFVSASQEVQRGTNSDKLTNYAEQVAVSYVLTGGEASYKGVKIKHQFDPSNGEWGEFELKARFENLSVDTNAFPIYANPVTAAQKATAWAIGVNWYLNKDVKLNLDYEQTSFKGGGGGTAANPSDREDEKVIMTRVQLVF